jgi:hypothetical protein
MENTGYQWQVVLELTFGCDCSETTWSRCKRAGLTPIFLKAYCVLDINLLLKKIEESSGKYENICQTIITLTLLVANSD